MTLVVSVVFRFHKFTGQVLTEFSGHQTSQKRKD